MLLTAGCSFVWGDELPGFEDTPPTHWEYTFTHKLASHLNIDYVNKGSCGASNNKIFRDVIDHLHGDEENPTHMVILWSAWQRAELCEDISDDIEGHLNIRRDLNMSQYSPDRLWNIQNKTSRVTLQPYYELGYDSRTDLIHGLTKMKTIELLCDSLGIKLLQGVFHKRMWSNILTTIKPSMLPDFEEVSPMGVVSMTNWIRESVGSLNDNSRLGMGRHIDMYSMTEKNGDLQEHGHPGVQTNEEYASVLHSLFQKL